MKVSKYKFSFAVVITVLRVGSAWKYTIASMTKQKYTTVQFAKKVLPGQNTKGIRKAQILNGQKWRRLQMSFFWLV